MQNEWNQTALQGFQHLMISHTVFPTNKLTKSPLSFPGQTPPWTWCPSDIEVARAHFVLMDLLASDALGHSKSVVGTRYPGGLDSELLHSTHLQTLANRMSTVKKGVAMMSEKVISPITALRSHLAWHIWRVLFLLSKATLSHLGWTLPTWTGDDLKKEANAGGGVRVPDSRRLEDDMVVVCKQQSSDKRIRSTWTAGAFNPWQLPQVFACQWYRVPFWCCRFTSWPLHWRLLFLG